MSGGAAPPKNRRLLSGDPETGSPRAFQAGVDPLLSILPSGGGRPARCLPRGGIFCIIGRSGTGKTVLAVQCALRAASSGERVLYVTVTRDPRDIRELAEHLGASLAEFEGRGLLKLLRATPAAGQEGAQQSLLDLTQELRSFSPDLVIVDGIHALFADLDLYTLFGLFEEGVLRLAEEGKLTVVVVANEDGLSLNPAAKQFIVETSDVVVQLDWGKIGNVRVRTMNVLKTLGLEVDRPSREFIISKELGGAVVLPLPHSLDDLPGLGDPINVELRGLEELLGGGIPRGSVVTIVGPTGAGKRELAAAISAEVANRGGRVLVLSFDLPRSDVEALLERFGLRPDRREFVTVRSWEAGSIVVMDQLAGIMRTVFEARPEFIVILGYDSLERGVGRPAALRLMRHWFYVSRSRGSVMLVVGRSNRPEEFVEVCSPFSDIILVIRRVRKNETTMREVEVYKSVNPGAEGRCRGLIVGEDRIEITPGSE